ncbi:MAG TPA: hypothetical protein PKA16_05515 [Ottowia sp.]|uniref:hypothetical protein n=1 Tax=Ottowia sp. TaxID=1898956 RepID=UPI002B613CAE|nr:hypothetical protein [Ottowia sp.]HMN20833.1 hypothetical protein [Ottowia sp.]
MSGRGTQALRWLFWLAAIAFVAWDLAISAPVNLRLEPPMITAGSGVPATGGHCAMPR